MGWEDPDSDPLDDVEHWWHLYQLPRTFTQFVGRKKVTDKYVVFKAEEFQDFLSRMKERGSAPMPETVHDAVVIRRQDIFAAPALDAYANAIGVAAKVLRMSGEGNGRAEHLQDVADFFHSQAELAYLAPGKKIPD